MTLLWGARIMKPDLTPASCSICGSPCALVIGPPENIAREGKELWVDTWWWECQGEPCLYPGGPFQFVDTNLRNWRENQIRDIWEDRFGEPFPGEVYPKEVAEPMVKETVLEGYYATGDQECFCFGKHDTPEACEAWLDENYPAHDCDDDDVWARRLDAEVASLMYPQDLLPEEALHRKGTWRIRVEFLPEVLPNV